MLEGAPEKVSPRVIIGALPPTRGNRLGMLDYGWRPPDPSTTVLSRTVAARVRGARYVHSLRIYLGLMMSGNGTSNPVVFALVRYSLSTGYSGAGNEFRRITANV